MAMNYKSIKQEAMIVFSDEYRMNVVNMISVLVADQLIVERILSATSQDEVTNIVDESIVAMQADNADSQLVSGVIEHVMNNLELRNPMKIDAQQWSNIKMAMILLNRIRNRLNAPVS
jgi:hypothetical protein